MKFKRTLAFVLLLCLSSMPLAAAGWLHVRVETDEQEQIRVNIPLSLVTTVLPIIERQAPREFSRHGIRIENQEISVAELRQIWAELKSTGNYELATIISPDANVVVKLEDDYLKVDTDASSRERVQVRVPVRVVDALLAGTGEELNLTAALEALQAEPEQEFVSVDAEDAKVRVWIDSSNEGN